MTDEAHDPVTGELPPREQAADGGYLPRPARTFGEFLRLINSGEFDMDVMADVQNAAAELQDLAAALGGKAKGKLVLTIDLEVDSSADDTMFFLRGTHKITLPTTKRPRSVAWTDEHNNFTANKPRQGQLFSQPREVGGTSRVREATSTRVVRDA